jgi:hypothetical protein
MDREHSYLLKGFLFMSVLTFLSSLMKGKALVTTAVSVSLLGSTGIALAATPSGQNLMQNLPGAHATVSPTHKPDVDHGKATADANKQKAQICVGLPEAQRLATKFSLSTDATESTMKTICALHDGSFKVTVDGKSFTTDHALGYGEIDLLLTYAQALTTKDGAKLTDDNVEKYITNILSTCGSTPIIPCVNSKIGENRHDNGDKPVIPTPHADGKPIVIPTPHIDRKLPPITITPPSN